jgi:exonuclease III
MPPKGAPKADAVMNDSTTFETPPANLDQTTIDPTSNIQPRPTFKIISLNTHASWESSKEDVAKHHSEATAWLCQETGTRPPSSFDAKHFKIYHNHHKEDTPRSSTSFLNKSIEGHFTRVNCHLKRTIRLDGNPPSGPLSIINVHAPSHTETRHAYLNDLAALGCQLEGEGREVIMMGDFNEVEDANLDVLSSNPSRKPDDTNPMRDLCARANLFSAIRAVRPLEQLFSRRHVAKGHTTERLIDHVLLTEGLRNKIIDAGVDQNEYQSDHRLIFLELDLESSIEKLTYINDPRPRYNLSNKDGWNVLTDSMAATADRLLKTAPQNPNTPAQVTEMMENIEQIFSESTKDTVGTRSQTTKQAHPQKTSAKEKRLKILRKKSEKLFQHTTRKSDTRTLNSLVKKINDRIAACACNIIPLPADWSKLNYASRVTKIDTLAKNVRSRISKLRKKTRNREIRENVSSIIAKIDQDPNQVFRRLRQGILAHSSRTRCRRPRTTRSESSRTSRSGQSKKRRKSGRQK